MTRDQKLFILGLLLLLWLLCRRRAGFGVWAGAAGEVTNGLTIGLGGGFGAPGAPGGSGAPGGGSGGSGGCCSRCGGAAVAPAGSAPSPVSPGACPSSLPDPFGSIGGGCCYWTGVDWGWAPLNHPICMGSSGSYVWGS